MTITIDNKQVMLSSLKGLMQPYESKCYRKMTYNQLLKMGIIKEQSTKGAALLEQASGQQSVKVKMEEEVRRLQSENKQLKNKMSQ